MMTRDELIEQINTNDFAVDRALCTLYKFQTMDEKIAGGTLHQNNLGFNGSDATFGSSLALQILDDKQLSPRQYAKARKMLMKYVNQLLKHYKKGNSKSQNLILCRK